MIERILSWIAPHYCVICSLEGRMLCVGCILSEITMTVDRCYRCFALSKDSKTCKKCRSSSVLSNVWVGTPYAGPVKKVLSAIKFKRAKAAIDNVSEIINLRLPILENTVLVPIPTSPRRVRQRGFDQSVSIARYISKKRSLPLAHCIARKSHVRQTGASKDIRRLQAKETYYTKSVHKIRGKNVVIVDDILTTGATIESVARLLKLAGAKSVSAAVIAQKI